MKRKIFKIVFIVFAIWFGYTITSNAAISAESKTVKSGESVQIKITSNQKLGAYTLKVTSNGGATFQSVTAPEGATAGGSTVTGASTSGLTWLGTYTFKMPAVSSEQKYQIKFSATGMETPNLEEVASDSATATITVKPTTTVAPPSNNDDNLPQESNPGTAPSTVTKSSNNYLASLKVSEGNLSPEFNFRTYNYKVDVGKDVESIKVTASAEHAKAKVSGTGTKTLKPGENKINVRVKAEDGKERTYTIVVNRQVEEEPTEDIKLGLKSISLQGVIQTEEGEQTVELPYLAELFPNVYSYNINLNENERDITAIKIEALANKEDAIVEILGNENLVEGDNIITIVVKSANGEETVTYQIIVNKPEQVLPINADVQMQEPNGVGWGPIQKTLITIFTTIIVLFGVAYGVIEYRYKKEDKEEFGIPYSNIETTKENKKTSKQKAKKAKKEEKEDVASNVLNNSIQETTGKLRSKKDSGRHF